MKKKTKLFKHFITLLNCMALSVPLLVLGITYLSDISARYFSSLSVSHSQTNGNFEDDLSYSFDKNTLPSINDYLFKTMDNVGYLDYDLNGYRQVEYQTNEVNSNDDLVVGNVYKLFLINTDNEVVNTTITTELYFQYINSNFALNKYFYVDDYFDDFNFLQSRMDNTEIVLNIILNDTDTYYCYLTLLTSLSYSSTDVNDYMYVIFTNESDFASIGHDFYNFVDIADLNDIPPQFEKVEGVDNLQEYQELIEGKSYNQIITNDVNTNMLVNFDFGKIFFNENMINQNGNIAPYLFINYMVNYFINISLFLFIPEFIICFFYMLRTLTYKFVDKEV